MYNFNGENQSELTVRAGQNIKIAPRDIQQVHRLLSTNWVLATLDGKTIGVVPVNYIKKAEVCHLPTTDITTDLTMDPVLVQEIPTTTDSKTDSNC
jgi:hypothetical protein